MKKIYVILALLVLLALPIVTAEASLKTSLLRYEPLPAEPGQYVTAYVKVENVGNEDAENVAVRFIDSFPFTIVSENERTETVGELKSQQSYVASFRARVDSNAVIGDNQFKVEFTKNDNNEDWQEKVMTIEVSTDEASLTISDVKSDSFVPGSDGTVIITVKNNEEIMLRNIALQLNMVTLSGSTPVDLPFIPTDSATEKRISRLRPSEIAEITYNIKAYPSATPGYYKLPVTISFTDDQGTETERTDYIGVVIEAQPELKVILDETKLKGLEQQGDITLKYINKGINDLKFLDTEILKSPNYEIIGGAQEYIGDLDSDDYRSETYTIVPKNDNSALQVKVTFKDENNEAYESTVSIPIMYAPQEEGNGGSPVVTVIVVLAIVGIIIYFVRRKNKSKRKR